MSSTSGALGKAQRDRLVREGRSLGPASMHGARLYNLGRYPGLVETGNPDHVVRGELIGLKNPQLTLLWLDDYEGLVSGDHDQNEYARVERDVRIDGGTERPAWVYVFLREVARFRPIASGRWKGPV